MGRECVDKATGCAHQQQADRNTCDAHTHLLGCPLPIPSMRPSLATAIALDLTCFTQRHANLRSSSCCGVGCVSDTTVKVMSSGESSSAPCCSQPPATWGVGWGVWGVGVGVGGWVGREFGEWVLFLGGWQARPGQGPSPLTWRSDRPLGGRALASRMRRVLDLPWWVG